MAKSSLQVIKSLKRLPSYFSQGNATFLKFKEYHSINPLISYFAGLYTVQILIDLITTKDSITGEPLVNDDKDITIHLVTVLENERIKLKNNEQYKSILKSSSNSREYIISFTDEIFDTVTALIETGQATGKTVTDLLTCATLYEIARGLFPFSELQKINKDLEEAGNEETEKEGVEEKQDIEETVKKELEETLDEKDNDNQDENEKEPEDKEVTLNGTEDLAKSLAQLVEPQGDDVQLEDHISKSLKDLTDTSEEPSKEDDVINELIAKDLSKIDDTELEEKIRYCKKNAQRIVTAVKKGENPQISTNSIDSKPITDEDIEKTIKFAMNEPSDDENDGGISFPELPSTAPGTKKESTPDPGVPDEDDEDSNDEAEDTDNAEFIAKHHTSSTHNKPIPKQIKKEDLQSFLEDGELLERATKCAKFAISAINYEDVDTALAELTKSIDLLNKFKERQE